MTTPVPVHSEAGRSSATAFMPVQIAGFSIDSVIDFALYIEMAPGDPPVLYRARNLPFTEDVRRRLHETGQKFLYIRADDEGSYRRYLEAHLGEVLSDKAIDLGVKSTVLYSSAQGLVREVMADPRSGDSIQRSRKLVEHTVNYLHSEHRSFEELLKITSFDYYTYTHSVNVFVFSISLAQRLGFDDRNALTEYGEGALLHDIGKSLLDPAIVNSRGRLTGEQWASMKLHPVYGYDILKEHGNFSEIVLDVTRHHHEKLRGGGYPDNLRGRQISPLVRVTTICDIFDALTTRRSYKDALNSFPSLRLMKSEMAGDLDADYFRAFVDMMGNPSG